METIGSMKESAGVWFFSTYVLRRSQLISPRSCTRRSANDSCQKKKPGVGWLEMGASYAERSCDILCLLHCGHGSPPSRRGAGSQEISRCEHLGNDEL